MKKYDNIIFDLGNVILNIDYQSTVKAFEKIGLKNAKKMYSKSEQKKILISLKPDKFPLNNLF